MKKIALVLVIGIALLAASPDQAQVGNGCNLPACNADGCWKCVQQGNWNIGCGSNDRRCEQVGDGQWGDGIACEDWDPGNGCNYCWATGGSCYNIDVNG